MIVFDDIITDILSDKKINPILIELFIGGRKLNISFIIITQFYFAVPKYIRPNSTCYFIIKVAYKQELQQIKFNHSLDIEFRGIMNLYKKYTTKTYSF